MCRAVLELVFWVTVCVVSIGDISVVVECASICLVVQLYSIGVLRVGYWQLVVFEYIPVRSGILR